MQPCSHIRDSLKKTKKHVNVSLTPNFWTAVYLKSLRMRIYSVSCKTTSDRVSLGSPNNKIVSASFETRRMILVWMYTKEGSEELAALSECVMRGKRLHQCVLTLQFFCCSVGGSRNPSDSLSRFKKQDCTGNSKPTFTVTETAKQQRVEEECDL